MLLTPVKKLADGVSVVELAVHLSIVGLNFRLLSSMWVLKWALIWDCEWALMWDCEWASMRVWKWAYMLACL